MKELKYTSQFKKDLKRIQNNPKRIEGLKKVLQLLREAKALPKEYKPHVLAGNNKGYMECHVESDFLLIWIDKDNNIVRLIRLDSHSELYS